LYVADFYWGLIRKINTSTGEVTTLAGNKFVGLINGPVASSSFYEPSGVAVDAAGNVFVADKSDDVIRKISVQ
jgi:DNA-binding beta-propeller fold protein YncE